MTPTLAPLSPLPSELAADAEQRDALEEEVAHLALRAGNLVIGRSSYVVLRRGPSLVRLPFA